MKTAKPMRCPWLEKVQKRHQERDESDRNAERIRLANEALRKANAANPQAVRRRYGGSRHGRTALVAGIIAASLLSQ